MKKAHGRWDRGLVMHSNHPGYNAGTWRIDDRNYVGSFDFRPEVFNVLGRPGTCSAPVGI